MGLACCANSQNNLGKASNNTNTCNTKCSL